MACLGGVWMILVNGFLGMRHYEDGLHFNPQIPKAWKSYCLRIAYQGARMEIKADQEKIEFLLVSGGKLSFIVGEKQVTLSEESRSFVINFPVNTQKD